MDWLQLAVAAGLGSILTSIVTYFLTERSKRKEREWNAKQNYENLARSERLEAFTAYLRYIELNIGELRFRHPEDADIINFEGLVDVNTKLKLHGDPDLEKDIGQVLINAIRIKHLSNQEIQDTQKLYLRIIDDMRARLRPMK